MSMNHSPLSTVVRHTPLRIDLCLTLARHVQEEREAMGLSVQVAAYIAGVDLSRWCAVEAGWVPADDDPLLRSLAETLEVNYLGLSLCAEISRYNQSLSL
jgi:hypothetical protein